MFQTVSKVVVAALQRYRAQQCQLSKTPCQLFRLSGCSVRIAHQHTINTATTADMVIIDEKEMLPTPPPPYVAVGPLNPPPFPSGSRIPVTFATLSAPMLLRIVYELFPYKQVEKQRKTLYWLTMYLRLVSRSVYVARAHELRSARMQNM
ncbi:hypothetical protein BKA93DRAFT_477964 [Sparassis latifolia]